jgi:hypothetical protein
MKTYYSVGHGEPCGHHHRSRRAAERCARHWLASNPDLRTEAAEQGMSCRQYVQQIVSETTGDCLIARITEN